MKKIMAIILALTLTFSLVACGGDSSSAAVSGSGGATGSGSSTIAGLDGEIKLGVITYLTGSSKETGDRQIQAVETAVKKINGEGGVNGAELKIEYFDAGTDQQSCINAVQLAVNTADIAGIVGVFQSTNNLAYADIVKEAKIPTMCLGTSYNVRDLGDPYMWMPRVCDETASQALARMCIERGMKNPCIMWMTNASGQSQHDAIVEYYEAQGLSIGLDLGFNVENETDYTPLVTQFLNSDCDGLIIDCYSNQGAPDIITLLTQYGYDMSKVAGVTAIFSSDLTDMVGGIVDGIYGISEYSPNADRAGTQAYVEAFEAEQNTFTSAWTDAVTYDAVLLLCEGARLGGGNDPESINNGLADLKDFTDGALTDYTYNKDHSLGSTLLITEFDGADITFSDVMSAR